MASNGLWVGYDQSDEALAKQLNDAEFPLWQMAVLGMMPSCHQKFLMRAILDRAEKQLGTTNAEATMPRIAATVGDIFAGLGITIRTVG